MIHHDPKDVDSLVRKKEKLTHTQPHSRVKLGLQCGACYEALGIDVSWLQIKQSTCEKFLDGLLASVKTSSTFGFAVPPVVCKHCGALFHTEK